MQNGRKGCGFMRKYLSLTILLCGVVVFLAACSGNTIPEQKGEPMEEGSAAEEAYHVVKENNEAANEKDVEAFVDTYVEEMQDSAYKQVSKAFKETDFQHDVSSPKVMEQATDHVILSVKQKTTDLTGENEDIEDIIEHELVLEDGEFKIKLSRPGE